MKSILQVLHLSADFLKKKGIANARRQAEELLSDALGLTRIDLYAQFERPLTDDELAICRERVMRRSEGEPCQYIHGSVEFFRCQIKVTPDVLIPRQETEILVEMIIKELEKQDLTDKVLWDLCCGSGAIGIALKKRFPQLRVIAADISKPALAVAKGNAQANNVEVEFREGDLFEPFQGEKTHFFVCNPPYISEEEYCQLDVEVRQYEPKIALVSGATGLEFYERVAKQLKDFLYPDGKIWFEIGYKQGEALKQCFAGYGEVTVSKDYAGHDRFLQLNASMHK